MAGDEVHHESMNGKQYYALMLATTLQLRVPVPKVQHTHAASADMDKLGLCALTWACSR